jgi:hypothetical protein
MPHWSSSPLGRPCHAFEKLDGSNFRAEWAPKRGWSKFGSRHHLIDERDEQLGLAVTLFKAKYADELARRFADKSWRKLGVRQFIVFCEYLGPNSFAGSHVDPPEAMDVVLFDINPVPRNFLAPREFLREFGDLHVPELLYEGNFNREFIDRVRRGELGVAEGIVAKGMQGKLPWMAKVKTDAWFERLRASYGEKAVAADLSGNN